MSNETYITIHWYKNGKSLGKYTEDAHVISKFSDQQKTFHDADFHHAGSQGDETKYNLLGENGHLFYALYMRPANRYEIDTLEGRNG